MINGVVNPSPSTVPSLSSVAVTTGDSFDISLPRSSMLIIRIPPANQTAQLPYGGTAWPIPGTIEAENYDTGGQFVAYYDTTAGNSGGQYRSDDVDIETCSDGGYDVTGIKTGEWLKYSVDVSSSGLYKITARVASADPTSNSESNSTAEMKRVPCLSRRQAVHRFLVTSMLTHFLPKARILCGC